MNLTRLFLVLISALVLGACSDSRWKADTDSISYDGTIHRLDEAVFNSGKPIPADSLVALRGEYGDFLDAYLVDIMRVGPADNPMTAELFNRFLTDPTWQQLQKVIEEKHPNMNSESDRLETAFKRFGWFFGESRLPKLIAYNSGFNVGIYPTDQYLGMGLEWYSGGDLKILNRLPPDLFPQYKRDKMAPRFLVPNALKGWLMVRFSEAQNGEDLLARMVFAGKILYTAKVLLGNEKDADLLNYSPQQMEWCHNQEYQIWKYILENDLLFSNESKKVEKMMTDGPFTPGMPQESPGGVGNWIGFQMVSNYMDNHKDTTLPQLMELENDRVFLNDYKP